MSISFIEFLNQVISNVPLLIITILTLGVILVNGWTDAPNAIATCVSTRSLSPKKAIMMAAVFNFLGVFVMTLINATVVQTIYNMVDFGNNSGQALPNSTPWPTRAKGLTLSFIILAAHMMSAKSTSRSGL